MEGAVAEPKLMVGHSPCSAAAIRSPRQRRGVVCEHVVHCGRRCLAVAALTTATCIHSVSLLLLSAVALPTAVSLSCWYHHGRCAADAGTGYIILSNGDKNSMILDDGGSYLETKLREFARTLATLAGK